MGYQTVKSVEKAMAMLDLVTDRSVVSKALSLAEIAAAAGVPPATARNLLRTLEKTGYVSRTCHGFYAEGPKCLKLFRCEGVLQKLKETAAPMIERAVRDLGESVLLAAIVRNKRVELLRCQAPDDAMVEPQWYANAQFYQMYSTRASLAWFSKERLADFVNANGLPSPTDWPECGGSLEGLRAELLKIRGAGGCMALQGGLAALAVPLLTSGEEAVASLGCYAPLSRTDKPRAAGIFRMLHDCAREIQRELASLR